MKKPPLKKETADSVTGSKPKRSFTKESPNKDHRRHYQQQDKQSIRNKLFNLAGLAVIILLGVIIYSNSFKCSFQFDDFGNIVDNTKIHDLSDVKAWWNFVPSRPLGNFTFALNYHFNQLDVRYYHLVNLLIHLMNAILVWWLTLLFFSSPALKDHPIARQKRIIAFFTAMLFVSHPLATQSVTYIVQRLASLVAMFYLLSLALYIKARLSGKGSKSRYAFFAGAFICAVLAMLTKENSITLPLAVLLFELFFLRTSKLSINFRDYRVILVIAAFLSMTVIVLLNISLSGVFKPVPPAQGNTYTITPYNYLLTQFSVIAKYIQLLFVPVNQNLDYDFPISNSFFNMRTMLCFLLLSSLMISAIFLYKKYRIVSYGIFWFFLTLSVESSIFPIPNVIFEHRTYLPSFGFFLILGPGIFLLLWKRSKYITISVLGAIIVINSVLTYERNKVWKDKFTLWSDAALKSPAKARPQYNLGLAYYDLGQWDKSTDAFSSAISTNPNYSEAYLNRGLAYYNLGRWDKAIADFSSAASIDPEYAAAYNNLGLAYDNLGQFDKSLPCYSRAIEIDPGFMSAYSNRGIAYINLKQWDKAILDFSKAIEIDPRFASAYNNLGTVYFNLGNWDKAIANYSMAIEIAPDYTQAYSNRDLAYQRLHSETK